MQQTHPLTHKGLAPNSLILTLISFIPKLVFASDLGGLSWDYSKNGLNRLLHSLGR